MLDRPGDQVTRKILRGNPPFRGVAELLQPRGDFVRCFLVMHFDDDLRPVVRGNAQLAEATLEVWAWQSSLSQGRRSWLQRSSLSIFYDGYLDQEPGF